MQDDDNFQDLCGRLADVKFLVFLLFRVSWLMVVSSQRFHIDLKRVHEMNGANLSVRTDDFDTLGGRLSRARVAKNSSMSEIAELVGVEEKTIQLWECDRSAPRSSLLTMLAGTLGISPTWLLFGRGASPTEESSAAHVETIRVRLDELKNQREKIKAEIKCVEDCLAQAESEVEFQSTGDATG